MQTSAVKNKALVADQIEIKEPAQCQKCRNVYVTILVVRDDKFKDFGTRHCPYCGLETDELGSIVP